MKAIVYLDYVSGNILFHKVDVSEMNYEYGGDIYEYADAYAPSNNCQWMEMSDNVKVLADKEIVGEIKKRIVPVKKNPGFLANCRFISSYIEEVKNFLNDKEIEYEEWWNDNEVEIRLDLENKSNDVLSLIQDRFDIKDIEKLTYLIFY